MGCPVYTISICKKESDFNWLAKPERIKLFKVYLINVNLAHLVTLKQLKAHGSSIKEKLETN